MSEFKLDINPNDDDDFFCSLQSQPGLGHVFGVNSVQKFDNKDTLPPTSPTPKFESTAKLNDHDQTWNLVLAKLVTAYKDGCAMGKLGMALMSNSSEGYNIVLYKTKNNIMATCALLYNDGEAGRVIYRQQAYLQFYDDSRSYWSLLFEKPNDEIEVIKRLQDNGVNVIELEEKESQHDKLGIIEKVPNQGKLLELQGNDIDPPTTYSPTASLLSRMSKLGHSLPTFKPSYEKCEFSDDSTDTEVVTTSVAVSSTTKPAIVPRNSNNSRLFSQKPQITSTLGAYSNCNLPLQMQETQLMHMMLNENRTQNTEMRMNMNKLEDKVERVLDKIMDFANGSNSMHQLTPRRDAEILELEEKLLELRKENLKLRQTVEINRIPKTQSVDAFITAHENQIKTLNLICPKHDWHELSKELIEKSTLLHVELQQMHQRNETLTKQFREKNEKVFEQSQQLEEKQDKVENLTLQLGELNVALDKQRRATQKLEDQIQELTQHLADKQIKDQSETKRIIKDIMNNLYSSIASQINAMPREKISSEQVLCIIGKVIKYETLQTMQ